MNEATRRPSSRGRKGSRRWGFADENRLPPDAVSIGAVVQSVVKRSGLAEKMWQDQVESDWSALVGATIAKHARPGRFENGLLTIFVDSSVWLNELTRYSADLLLSKLRGRFPQITQVRFHADPDPGIKR